MIYINLAFLKVWSCYANLCIALLAVLQFNISLSIHPDSPVHHHQALARRTPAGGYTNGRIDSSAASLLNTTHTHWHARTFTHTHTTSDRRLLLGLQLTVLGTGGKNSSSAHVGRKRRFLRETVKFSCILGTQRKKAKVVNQQLYILPSSSTQLYYIKCSKQQVQQCLIYFIMIRLTETVLRQSGLIPALVFQLRLFFLLLPLFGRRLLCTVDYTRASIRLCAISFPVQTLIVRDSTQFHLLKWAQ